MDNDTEGLSSNLDKPSGLNDAIPVSWAAIETSSKGIIENNEQYAEDYQTVKALGKGGFGYVFEAINKLDHHRRAVKRVSFMDKHGQEQALKEVRTLVQLDHPDASQTISDSKATNSYTSNTSAGKSPSEDIYPDSGSSNFSFFLKPSLTAEESIEEHCTESENTSSTSNSYNHDDEEIDCRPSLTRASTKISYLYYSMELCEGDTLERRLKPFSLTKEQTCNILYQITEGLAYIHGRKLIHGDIKPANIFLTAGNSIKIGDFGLAAKILDGEQTTIVTDVVYGTHFYMAPEIRKKREAIRYNEKIDMYALGIIALELLAPFKTAYERSKILQQIREYSEDSEDINSIFTNYGKAVDFNLSYEPIVKWLLKPSASERPSAKDLLQDKFFCRLIKGIHVDKFLSSARLTKEIHFQSPNIQHGCFDCSDQIILLCERNTFLLFDATGQKLSEVAWSQNHCNQFGFITQIIWSVYLKMFLVLSQRALFTFNYVNPDIKIERKVTVYAVDIRMESRLKSIACGSRNDYLFLNRGCHTLQQFKMSGWMRYREWTKTRLNYQEMDEIHAIKVDRNGAYLVMDVLIDGATWVIDVRATDDQLTLLKRITGFHHKLQLFSPDSHWLFVHGDPNKLHLSDVHGDVAQIPKEVSFGNHDGDPQHSFSEHSFLVFRWMGEGRLLLGTAVENDQSGVLKIYTV